MTDFEAARRAMVDCQVRPSDVTSYRIIEAMLWAPRERFAPKSKREVAYAGAHIALGGGRVLLDPRVFAKMLDAAEIGPEDLVLDLACGPGYSSAVLSRLAAAVVAVEPDPAMAAAAAATLAGIGVDTVIAAEGDPAAGDPAHGPYDVIFVNGAVERIPQALLAQLKDGGRLVAIWSDNAHGQCRVTRRNGDVFSTLRAFDATAPVLAGFEKPPEFVF